MDDIKKNKLAIGVATVVVGVAALYYIYNRKKQNEEVNIQRTFAFIKPDAFGKYEEIMKEILDNGFTIIKSRKITLTQEQASLFYCEHKKRKFFPELIKHITSGQIYALMLERPNAVKAWRDMMGPTDPNTAKKEAPNSLRAKYANNITQNAVHGSDSIEAANRETGFFFDD